MSCPIIIVSSNRLYDHFASRYASVLDPACIWVATGHTEPELEDIYMLLDGYDTPVRYMVLIMPLTSVLFSGIQPVIRSTVVACLPYSTLKDVENWFDAVCKYHNASKIIITTMQKPFYVKWSRLFCTLLKQLHATKHTIVYKPPEITTKKELAKLLSAGFGLCLYTGHGRPRGWSGYRGIRWADISDVPCPKPSGVVLSLSCSAFRIENKQQPFAIQWLLSGRIVAFAGFTAQVQIQPLIVISHLILDFIAEHDKATFGDLVKYIDGKVAQAGQPAVMEVWKSFRLAGNPLVCIL